jgi:cytoskeletal protein CcmA (bactofilin family)
MFSQSADQPAADQSPAPVGMRELPPQPAKPVMPTYGTAVPTPVDHDNGPGADDSVIARDDYFEGTFTSRGTVVVMGSVKGRIEAIQVRIEDGARVDADVIVDEAIIAGEFTGNLTCRDRLEAHASGRINGRVETHRLMLHEGASVEGEMHMLTDKPTDAAETIRGSAPLRGEASEGKPAGEARAQTATSASTPDARSAPVVAPSSNAKAASSTSGSSATSGLDAASSVRVDASTSARRDSVVETLRAESMRVAPRTTTVSSYSGGPTTVASPPRPRNGSTPAGF